VASKLLGGEVRVREWGRLVRGGAWAAGAPVSGDPPIRHHWLEHEVCRPAQRPCERGGRAPPAGRRREVDATTCGDAKWLRPKVVLGGRHPVGLFPDISALHPGSAVVTTAVGLSRRRKDSPRAWMTKPPRPRAPVPGPSLPGGACEGAGFRDGLRFGLPNQHTQGSHRWYVACCCRSRNRAEARSGEMAVGPIRNA